MGKKISIRMGNESLPDGFFIFTGCSLMAEKQQAGF